MGKILLSQIVGTNIAYYRYSFDYFLDSMDELGIHQIEIWGGSNHFSIYDSAKDQTRYLKKKLKSRGFRCISMMPEQNVYAVNIAIEDEYIREKSIAYIERFIEACSELECSRFLLNPGRPYLDRPMSEGYKWARDSVEKLIRCAEKNNVILMFENLNDRESCLATNAQDQYRIIKDIDSPYLACCVDTVPVACMGEKLEQYFELMGEKLVHIHLNDGKPWGHMKWGDGNQNLDEHLNAMRKYNYTGYIDLEIDNGSYLLDPTPHYRADLEAVIPHFDGGVLI